MAKQSKEQKETVERVMHEFKHGELETGTGKKVRNPKQAIAIGLREAGASKYESEEENRENLKRTKERERRGQTAQDEEEGGGQGRTSGKSDRAAGSEKSKAELYEEAKEKDIPGRSKMSKDQLARALHKHDS
jgi:uncharacterized protein DUF6496